MSGPQRNRRAGVEDLWTKTIRDENGNIQTVPSKRAGSGRRWRARYVDDRSQEHSKAFTRKVDAQRWLDSQTAAIVAGTHVAPRDAQLTVKQWCDLWIEGYKVNRASSVRQARTHIRLIDKEFGHMLLAAIRPSQVKAWVAKLQAEEFEASYVYALHRRLSKIMSDAVHDGFLGRNPCSRRTSPPMGKAKPYVATTEQVWAIHDAMPEHLRVAVLLGAFAGLRVAEVSGLRVADVDFIRGVVHPQQQWPADPLKTPGSATPIPIPQDLALLLSASVQAFPSEMMVTNAAGGDRCGPWLIERAFRKVCDGIDGLPEGFRFHDLRHYLASLLIASGADIKTVQARMRHASARTTLDTYGHLWPDADESTRSAIGAVIAERMGSAESTAYPLRTRSTPLRRRRRSEG
ncbi:site-specific integrase [Mycobacterium sp. E796]|uniref:tyrosine-type recombinase/integrase n=1 Tax=Mycobacterium sp. E796 TaxID=1834151 RepID=UPI0007FBA025|nr:site-specific integrase [Mycobacterium sp. E796]OBI52963.1 integrase [Mycobacterium sp. E796]